MNETVIVAGLLFRGALRRELQTQTFNGVQYVESRGLLDSQFTVTGPPSYMRRLNAWIEQNETVRVNLIATRRQYRRLKVKARNANIGVEAKGLRQKHIVFSGARGNMVKFAQDAELSLTWR